MITLFNYIPVSTLLLALTFIAYSLFARKVTDYGVVLFTVMVIEMLHSGVTYMLLDLSVHTHLLPLINVLWYFTFAITNIIAIAAMFLAARYLRLTRRGLITPVSVLLAVISVLQVARYIDRIVIQSDILADYYSPSIQVLNGCIIGLVFVYLLKEIVLYIRNRVAETPYL